MNNDSNDSHAVVEQPKENLIPSKKMVSYSQFSNWFDCPHRWYLNYVKNLKMFEDSIATCFGDAIHEVLQLYIETLYKKSTQEADSIEIFSLFKTKFQDNLNTKKVKYTDDDLINYTADGIEILKEFLNIKNRIQFFPSNKYEFISVEDEIIVPIKNNVDFICYIDIVLKDKTTGRYKIIDIKTSSIGWLTATKNNPAKYSQILLYKVFFSKKYNIPLDMIDVEFFILKRKLLENVSWPQKRIQIFVPNNNHTSIVNVMETFSQFISECFKSDGTFVEDVSVYPKNPGKWKKNCKNCPHKKINCDTKSDIDESELS